MITKLPKTLERDDVLGMLAKINRKCPTGCRNYAILIFMYRGGLRVQEALNLTEKDVNLKNEILYVQQSKGRSGKKKDRYVPMDEEMIEAAKLWMTRRPASDFFFCTMDGGQIDQRYIREVCYRLSSKAGVYIQDGRKKKKPSPHKLRHTYATELLEEGFNTRELQELLGHSSPITTEIYTHIVLNKLSEKIQKRSPMIAGHQ